MDKILIFSASTGEGHNQVASALEAEFKLCGYNVVRMDFLKETSRLLDLIIADGYNLLAVHSAKIYGLLYRTSNHKKINRSLSHLFVHMLNRQINNLIMQQTPDLIISTHPFVINIVGALKARGSIHVPLISVVTDFDAHRCYINRLVDAYITPCEQTAEALINNGIPRNRVFQYGIPIRQDFLVEPNQNPGSQRKFSILVMGGSMGVSSIKKVVNKLLQQPQPIKIIVVCGNNRRLKASLEHSYHWVDTNKELIIYGFTRNIAELMDNVDVIFTKPGGITTSEAIARKVPMVIPYFIPGQEEGNAKILVKNGVAIKITNLNQINQLVSDFINRPEILREMRNNMFKLSRSYSPDGIIRLADQLIQEYQTTMEMNRNARL